MRGSSAQPGHAPQARARERGGAPPLRPLSAPVGEHPSVCPHCWMVNPGPFRLCARCGAAMDTFLQESGGLRRTAPVQSPVPVTGRLTLVQRVVVALCVLAFVLAYLVQLLPSRPAATPQRAPVGAGAH